MHIEVVSVGTDSLSCLVEIRYVLQVIEFVRSALVLAMLTVLRSTMLARWYGIAIFGAKDRCWCLRNSMRAVTIPINVAQLQLPRSLLAAGIARLVRSRLTVLMIDRACIVSK